MTLKNSILLDVLAGKESTDIPVWFMRQAGRYMQAYQQLKNKYDFFTRVQTPALATEITMQPIREIAVDAAILFSDILVVPQAMGMIVEMHEGKGPLLPSPLKNQQDISKLIIDDAPARLHYVYEAIRQTKIALQQQLPLIGFAGAPFTLFCYMIEGKGSKTFDQAKAFCYHQPQLAKQILDAITTVTISYLEEQIKAGVDCLQLFDSWAGLLDVSDFATWSLPYIRKIVSHIKGKVPIIVFAKGVWHSLADIQDTHCDAIGIDWAGTPQMARHITKNNIVLQGNLDPAKLLLPIPILKKEVQQMIDDFGTKKYIANVGHGILPSIHIDHVKAFVEAVKTYMPRSIA